MQVNDIIAYTTRQWIWLPQVGQWLIGHISIATVLTATAWLVKFIYQSYSQGFHGYKDLNKYTGDYDAYYYSSLNEPKISCMRFKIRKKWFGGLTIFNSDKNYTYRGDVIKTAAQLHMYLPEKSGDEFLHYVLHAPLIGKPTLLPGVFSAVSSQRDPLAAKVLFVRREKKIEKNARDAIFDDRLIDPRIVNFLQLKPASLSHPNHIIVVKDPGEYSLDDLTRAL